MDPTTVPPPSPEKSQPPPPPNPHTPPAITDAPAFDCYQKDDPSTKGNMNTFKTLVSKLAGRLLPAHQSIIEQRVDDMIPDELIVPNHPPYADMILTALWELNTDGGSSEEAISDFILKEYHSLPWAHSTILNHHLRDLCMKRKIFMTHDRLYLRCVSTTTTKPPPSQPKVNNDTSSSTSTPISSPSSSSSTSSSSNWSSPTSSSSSLEWDPPSRRQRKRKRKRKKGRGGKMVQVRVRVRNRGKGKSRGSGRGRGRGRPKKILETSDEDEVTGMEIEEEDDGGEKLQNLQQENKNEVMEKGDLVESQKIEEQNGNGKEKGEMVELRRSGRRRNGVGGGNNVGAKEENHCQEQSDADVIKLEDDVINGDGVEVDAHVESLKQEEEEEEEEDAINVECEEQETEVNEEPVHQEEELIEMTSEKLESCGQDLLKNESTEEQPQHEEQETEINQKESEIDVVETDEQIDAQVETEVCEDGKNQEEELNKVNEKDTEEQVEVKNEETVTSEAVNKVTENEVVLGLMSVESESEEEEEETAVEIIQPQKPLKEEVVEIEKRQPLRERLRSSCKKQEPTPKVKKQLEQVPPVRRSLRSRKTNEEEDIVIEDPDHPKEHLEYSGRTRSSKRLQKTCEAEQVSSSKKTRRN